MIPDSSAGIESAQVVLPCQELDQTLRFFTESLGFRLDAIHPADDPAVAEISGYGLRIQLRRATAGSVNSASSARSGAAPGILRLRCRDSATLGALAALAGPIVPGGGTNQLTAPNGTRIELVLSKPPLVMPPLAPSFVLERMGPGTRWVAGRAGMRYRDLIPGRQGGRFIASQIQIPDGGPVPDYVHFHNVRFQMIYCVSGWVRVVYEDQGAQFVLRAGDCVLQPPRIRHRVLECSAGLEVIEISSPAEHETFADHDLPLPAAAIVNDREFEGQRFVRHEIATAKWEAAGATGFERRDLGIARGTGGIGGAAVLRARREWNGPGDRELTAASHDAELLFRFVFSGSATLTCENHGTGRLGQGDAFVIPAGSKHALTDCSDTLEFLEVSVPASG